MKAILYVIDALRADHVPLYGYHRDTMPNLGRLAQEGVTFRNCFAPATWTRPVAASLLTGFYPAAHGVHTLADTLAPGVPAVAVSLQQAGVQTAAFSAAGNVSPALGFGHGFDHFEALYRAEALLAARKPATSKDGKLQELGAEEIVLPLAEDVNEAFLRWHAQQDAESWFALLWTLDAHAPYDPPQDFRRFSAAGHSRTASAVSLREARTAADIRPLIDLYDDEISYVDACLGQLVETLQARGEWDETLLIVTSDHGEAFLEHGTAGHGHLPFDELLHVPLVMKFPGGAYAGREVAALTWLGDIPATLLEMASAPAAVLQGQSVLSLLRAETQAIHEAVFSHTALSGVSRKWLSARTLRWKYITTSKDFTGMESESGDYWQMARLLLQQGRWLRVLRQPLRYLRLQRGGDSIQLYDLASDPAERSNVMAAQPEAQARLARLLAVQQAQSAALASAFRSGAGTIDLDEEPELHAHLKALGYVD